MPKGRVAQRFDLPRPLPAPGQTRQGAAYQALRDAILSGLLPAGSALPSSRGLAERWQLARGTLEEVFDRLRLEGYIERRVGAGSRVRAVLPEFYHRAPPPPAPRALAEPLAAVPAAGRPRVGVPFAARLANPQLLAPAVWGRHLQRAMAGLRPEQLGEAEAQGALALREQVAAYLRSQRGIPCQADELIITHGIRHGLDLVARCLLRPGDGVAVEDPGYPVARRIFQQAGARVQHARVDEQGLDPASLGAGLRLAYVTPAHQSPLGASLPAERRLGLLAWAEREQAWVLEDDYDSQFNYRSAPLPALKAIDRGDRVIYCGSFNQALFANLRVGYLLAPRPVREQVLGLWQVVGRSVGISEQLGLAAFMASGDCQRHLRRARLHYQGLRDTLLAELASAAPGCRVSGEHAGFHLTLWLPAGCDEARLLARGQAAGLDLYPLSQACHGTRLPPALILGYAALAPAQVRQAARVLVGLLAG